MSAAVEVAHFRRECGPAEVQAFTTSLVSASHVAPSMQHQAVSAVLFLYRNVRGDPMGWTHGIAWAKRTRRLPTVLSPAEVARVINALDGQEQLMARILYGTWLRLLELLRLRVKDVDFDNGSVLARCGKGMKDRITVLPDSVREPLEAHIANARRLRERDVKRGGGYVEPPLAGRICGRILRCTLAAFFEADFCSPIRVRPTCEHARGEL